MIDPKNLKLNLFHLILTIVFYVDVVMTCFLISNYYYQRGVDGYENYMNHVNIFHLINAIEGIDIVLNFFKIHKIDIVEINDPFEIALKYLEGEFWLDIVSVIPYNMYWPQYIWVRLIRARNNKIYTEYIITISTHISSDIIDPVTLRKIIDSWNTGIKLVLVAHFFACIWILVGLKLLVDENKGWIKKTMDDDR